MLVLSRHKNTDVVITLNGVEVTVMVVEILGDKVRLGFQAPPEVSIHRREVYDSMRADGSVVSLSLNKEAQPNVSDHK